jgi:dTDP-glucose pyrophosphorylase
MLTQFRPDGTANAINLAKEHIDDDVIVLSGDIIYDKEDIKKLIQTPNSLLYTIQDERLEEYGTMDMALGDKILNINEKSTTPTSNLVNCGAYHFTKDVFEYIPKTDVDERFNERIITNTINLMIDNGIEFTGIKINRLDEITYPEDIAIVEKRMWTEEDEERVKDRMRLLGYHV